MPVYNIIISDMHINNIIAMTNKKYGCRVFVSIVVTTMIWLICTEDIMLQYKHSMAS